jgi:hypothetical protein
MAAITGRININYFKMKAYTIYYNPSDYPGLYVLRASVVGPGRITHEKECETAETMEELLPKVPQGMIRMPLSPNDDPVIVAYFI